MCILPRTQMFRLSTLHPCQAVASHCEFDKAKKKRFDAEYFACKQMNIITFDDGTHVDFTINHFTYLGSIVEYDLVEELDIIWWNQDKRD
jgi:hypothetical protein